ncbi:MAG: GNAT family N-acetyltransferase, partial [Roseibium sp.]|uniref:GNAT family N-acetyltransferase n=1 Tax=Roseibium sp. TaxID=1936156 RepID=UPI0026068D50
MNRDAKVMPTESQVQFRLESDETHDFTSKAFHLLCDHSRITAFQSPQWLDLFYSKLVPSLGAQPLVLKIYIGDSCHPDVVIPLVRERYYGFHILQPADLGVADYNAIIGSNESLTRLAETPGFKEQLIEALQPFDLLLFRKQRQDVFDVGRLFAEVSRSLNINSAYDVNIGEGYENWLKTCVSKNSRSGLRRKRNAFGKEVGKLEYVSLSNAKEIHHAFKAMRELRSARFENDLLSKPEYFDFYLKMAELGAEKGDAVTFVGLWNDQIMSIDFGLRCNGRFLLLLGAFSGAEHHQRYSLGLLGLTELIRQETARGTQIFDFTIGDEPYKRTFGAEKVALHNVSVINGLRGQAAFA